MEGDEDKVIIQSKLVTESTEFYRIVSYLSCEVKYLKFWFASNILFGTNNFKATNILNAPNLSISGYRFIYIRCHRFSATNLSEMEPNLSIDATIFILLIY